MFGKLHGTRSATAVVNLFGPLLGELGDVLDADAEGLRDAPHGVRARLAGAPLEVADGVQRQTGGIGEFLLRPPLQAAQLAQWGHGADGSGVFREYLGFIRYMSSIVGVLVSDFFGIDLVLARGAS